MIEKSEVVWLIVILKYVQIFNFDGSCKCLVRYRGYLVTAQRSGDVNWQLFVRYQTFFPLLKES